MDIEDIRSIYGTRTPGVIGEHRFYSVLVPFVVHWGKSTDTAAGILYEVRAEGVRQPGEICFPGGHMEEGETPEECAVRETCEELGINRDNIQVLGQGDTLYGANFTLYTFIGSIDEAGLDSFMPDPEEVSETFTVPVEILMDSQPDHYGETMKPIIEEGFPYEKVGIDKSYPWRTPEYDIPVYDIDGRVIWGLTGRITENVVKQLRRKQK